MLELKTFSLNVLVLYWFLQFVVFSIKPITLEFEHL